MGKYRIVTTFRRSLHGSRTQFYLYYIVEFKKSWFSGWTVLNTTMASDGFESSKKFIEEHKKLNQRTVVYEDPQPKTVLSNDDLLYGSQREQR